MKKTKGYIIAIHCFYWFLFFSLPAFFIFGHNGIVKISGLLNPLNWLEFTIYILVFYLHTYLLFPRFYFGKKYFFYFVSTLLLLAAVIYLRPFDNLDHNKDIRPQAFLLQKNFLVPAQNSGDSVAIKLSEKSRLSEATVKTLLARGPKVDLISIMLFFLVIAVSITVVITKRWRLAVEAAAKAEADKAQAELAVLKAQIHPHFLFNTLNNIYSQAVTNDVHTAESILKLSNIMRYVTDDATENFVSLQKEMDFITDYIALQKLRLGNKTTVNFTSSGDLENKSIAPLILITFIENVFKYGSSNSEPSGISINLKADDNSINFSCRNKLFPYKPQLERTGIGIINTKKRLEHLYPGKYLLNVKKEEGFYSVHLVIQD